MRLKSLEMQGFKSFPDKIKFQIDDGITAVVGPNGSGKSNISDAVRWVLGEQSAKTLRGGKMEDVVFNGTKGGRHAQSFAEVSLIIDNTDKSVDMDSDEIVVTRKYFRSGESEYRINGNAVRLKDVHEMFMDTGLGRDGYSIIGKSKIDEIISAKSENRREIFEEASGISKYRYRKDEAERKLELAEENLLRLRDILSELEVRVEPLRIQSEKAEKFIRLAADRRHLEISIWVKSIEKIKSDLQDFENKISSVRLEYDDLSHELEGIDNAVNEAYENTQRIGGEIENLRRLISEEEEKTTEFTAQKAVMENDILHAKERLSQIEVSLSEADSKTSDVQAEIDKKLLEKEELRKLEKECDEKLEADNEKLETLKNKDGEMLSETEKKSERISEISVEISEKTVAAASSGAAAQNLKERILQIESVLLEKSTDKEANEKELRNCKELIDAINEKAGEFDNAKAGVMSLYNIKKQKLDKLSEEQNGYLAEAQNKLSRAAILTDLEKNMDGMGGSIKAVVKRAKEGGLRGILGPVSKILTTDGKYSVAIETALGAAIQNIVVENEENAKAAIGYLKNGGFGRATFLPITSVRPSALTESGIENLMGYVDIAANLVTYDKKYEPVIKYLLGRVVVAEDIDSAAYISKKYGYKFKTVTLDGQVVNAGGSFTGGSRSAGSGILSRAAEIEKLKDEADKLQKKADALNGDIDEVKEEVSSFDAKLLALESEKQTYTEDIIRYDAEYKRLSGIKEDTDNEIASLTDEKEKTEKAISLHELNVKGNNEAIEKLNVEREALKAELETAGKEKDSLSEEREKLTESIVNGNMHLLEIRKDIENIQNTIDSLTEQKDIHEDRNTEMVKEKEAALGQIAERENAIAKLDKTFEDIKNSIEAKRNSIIELSSRREDAEKQITLLRAGVKDKTDRKEELSVIIVRHEERKAAKQSEYDSIISKLWNEYELTRSDALCEAEDIEDLSAANKSLTDVKNKIRNLGSVNVAAIDEYKEVSERYTFLKTQVDDVEKSKAELTKLIGELTRDMSKMFLESFDKINHHFSKIFTELFGGGEASLELTDRNDVLNCGIEIKANPPGKLVKNLFSLSDGEKSLVAISIYFSILTVKPSPFCILDEFEAALDDVNVTRYAGYLRRMCTNTQFIAITHRRGTMEEADILYGVTMQEDGVSKILKLSTSEIESKLGMKEQN